MSQQKRVLFNCFATKQCLGMLKCEVSLFFALSESYWISPCLSLALYGSLWLPLWLPLALTATLWLTLALSGPLLPFNFAYIVLDRLSGPLLGSQRRCHADSLCSGLAIDDYEGNLLGGLIYIFVFFVICSKKRNIDFQTKSRSTPLEVLKLSQTLSGES